MRVETTNSLPLLLIQHLTWYPLMGVCDIYKLLYQAELGSGHLVSSSGDFSRRLQLEFGQLVPASSERIIEPVRPDLTLFRLNLRPWKAHSDDLDGLIPCLLDTAAAISGDLLGLKTAWQDFVQLCFEGIISNFNHSEILEFTTWLDEAGFPAVHHSEIYQKNYQPAYRLISHNFIHQLRLDDAV